MPELTVVVRVPWPKQPTFASLERVIFRALQAAGRELLAQAFGILEETALYVHVARATESPSTPVGLQTGLTWPLRSSRRRLSWPKTCLNDLRDTYAILFYDFEPLDTGGPQTVAALKTNDVQIGLLFSTDPSIRANGFVPSHDDKHLQDAENITPVIRTEKLNDEIRHLLDAVSAKLTTENVTTLVGKVVLDGQDVPSVARDFLTAKDLI